MFKQLIIILILVLPFSQAYVCGDGICGNPNCAEGFICPLESCPEDCNTIIVPDLPSNHDLTVEFPINEPTFDSSIGVVINQSSKDESLIIEVTKPSSSVSSSSSDGAGGFSGTVDGTDVLISIPTEEGLNPPLIPVEKGLSQQNEVDVVKAADSSVPIEGAESIPVCYGCRDNLICHEVGTVIEGKICGEWGWNPLDEQSESPFEAIDIDIKPKVQNLIEVMLSWFGW
jgi:hypothetical protein